MAITISTNESSKTFNKNVINVGNQQNCDVIVNSTESFVISIQVKPDKSGFSVINVFGNQKILFRGQPMGQSLSVTKACKLMIDGTDDFVAIKLQTAAAPVNQTPVPQPRPSAPAVTMTQIAEQDFDEEDIRELYGDNVNAATKIKLDKRKMDIESRRAAILKEISYYLDDAKKKIMANGNAEKFLAVALIAAPVILAASLSDAIQHLISVPANVKSFFPVHMRLLVGIAILMYVTALSLKQGIFLHLQDKLQKTVKQKTGSIAKVFMTMLPVAIILLMCGVVLLFYFSDQVMEQGQAMTALISIAALFLCALAAGYFKSTMTEAVIQLDEYENREDFKKVLVDYQQWIGLFINNLSSVKLRNIRDKGFNLKLKAAGEVVLGILTSPFLAYGVSNTLAMCFPEAAGWIRISGLRFSPVFLVLATFLIIFAFFSLTSAFVSTKRVNGAEVIKNDGFNNYMYHGVDIFGTEAVKKLKSEGFRAFIIALSIIVIEFTMNVSYFMKEIGGGEWGGIFLSFVAALVPTALLVAETFMLSHTQYEIHTTNEILSRLDKEI